MKTGTVFEDGKLNLAGKLVYWSHPEKASPGQFAIIDDNDLGTHNVMASINMVMRNIGAGKKVRLTLEVSE
ncbi:MAG: hypothetical protein P4N41_11125 [Negativicutes bacterium]|nr:hypothetical protein [Negativicutes bacterium]